MRSFLFSLATLTLGLGLTSTASAGEYHHGFPHHGPVHVAHGHPHPAAHFYYGHEHHQWGYQVWSPEYRRYHYWDPIRHCFFYYVPDQDIYYPCP
jgi:hypothetical protein